MAKIKNSLIHKALLKYGYSNFKLEILEYCDTVNCIEREQFYRAALDLLKPEYNILLKAGSTLGYKHTDASKAKMKNFQISEEVRKVKLQSVAKAGEANRVKVVVVNIKTLEKKEYLSKQHVSFFCFYFVMI